MGRVGSRVGTRIVEEVHVGRKVEKKSLVGGMLGKDRLLGDSPDRRNHSRDNPVAVEPVEQTEKDKLVVGSLAPDSLEEVDLE